MKLFIGIFKLNFFKSDLSANFIAKNKDMDILRKLLYFA